MTDKPVSKDAITVQLDHGLAVRLRKDVSAADFRSVSALVNAIVASFYGEGEKERLDRIRPPVVIRSMPGERREVPSA
jgi:hypothetical protein